ncbi:hypothetical protein [Helicobacter himalayensis]|uniref:hypothetical protein n=1 Tax=Helicobacter himalayensis TaxID=1591088 RepID=UPI00083500A2|nr:hypothetical protein [Helicobacter himalayensis]
MQEELLEERESEENPALQEETQELENSREIVSKLESELEQNMQSFEKDFAKFCAKEVENNPSLEELFFDDKEKLFCLFFLAIVGRCCFSQILDKKFYNGVLYFVKTTTQRTSKCNF